MQLFFALLVVLVFVAAGDIVSLKTRAKVPALAASIILYLIAIWIGMPQRFPADSGMAVLGDMTFPIFVAGIATSVIPKQMFKEWRFIVIGCIGVILGLLFTVLIGGIFFDPREMFAGAMTTCGSGLTGGLLAIARLKEMGLVEMLTVPVLLAGTIDAIGQPVGSLILQKYVKKLVASDAYLTDKPDKKQDKETKCNRYGAPFDSAENPSPWFTAWIPPQYETPFVAFLQLAVIAALAQYFGTISGLGWSFMTIVVGLILGLLGFVRLNMLDRTQSFGLVMIGIYAMVFQVVNDLTFAEILSKIIPILMPVILGGTGLVLGGMLGAKIFGYDIWLGASATIGLFYLFPGVKNVIEEVARSLSRNEDERQYLVAKVSSPSIIAASVGSKFCLLIGSILIPIILR